MGGDTFEGVQKLTNTQYNQYVPEILAALKNYYVKAEPYIPLPEKQVHGDVDFLMILAPDVDSKTIIQGLKMEKFIINKNNTINSVYKNKQIDFCFVTSQKEFQMMRFYKSYSGMGAYLGMFLPSKQIKLSDKGLFALGYQNHIKYEHLLSNSVQQILKFYGLDFKRFQQGFQTRIDLFNFMLGCKFLNAEKFKDIDGGHCSKLTKFFIKYLNEENINIQNNSGQVVVYEDPKKQTLEYFKQVEIFQQSFEDLLKSIQRKQNLKKKFNATHIIQKYGIKPKQVNKWKNLFTKQFKSEHEYDKFIQQRQLEQILDFFHIKVGQIIEESKQMVNKEIKQPNSKKHSVSAKDLKKQEQQTEIV